MISLEEETLSRREFDVIVIGAGAGGLIAAWELSARGLQTLLLERGPRFSPGHDYPFGRPGGEFLDPFTPHIPDTVVSENKAYPPGIEELRTTLFETASSRRLHYARACGVGGSTLRYQAEAHRFPPHTFRMHTLFGQAVDWPLTYDDLAPYYARVEDILGVAGEPHPAFPRQGPYPNPAHRLSPSSLRIAKGCRRLGWTLSPNTLAILSRPYRGRLPCVGCKACVQGCLIGDKSSVDVAVLPQALHSEKLELRSGLVALRIALGRNGRVREVHVVDEHTGKQSVLRGKAVVLAAGAVETPRLLLQSACPGHTYGLANSSGLVGCNLMENIHAGVCFYFPEKLDTHKGVPIDGKVFDFLSPSTSMVPGRGCTVSTFGAPDFARTPGTFALRLAPGIGQRHRRFVETRFGSQAMVFATAECLPRTTNQVRLATETDQYGVPKALLDVTLQPDDVIVLKQLLDACMTLVEATGVEHIAGTMSSLDDASGSHLCGTVRMGNDPTSSVVNAFGQSHDVPNLFVLDGSILCTQGCGLSPSLTIQALALRGAEYLADCAIRDELS
ncbi:GMC family oxidoreductase [Desulfovibrio inopinatus]|uniref:GMC family oxidoreductase n=1 Tax=Desulfovibrio inopinatus TaxID=102109 RepID=UPI00041DF72A|nr:GMC family oxidoreductase [Desulfovibrio inopinatus]